MSKRGIRRTSMRARLAVVAAVLVGGGAAGVVAISASHSDSGAAAESAGYYQTTGRTLSYTSALSSAVGGWKKSPGTSLMTISHMKPVVNYWTQSWHHAVIFIQRGTVVAVGKDEFAVESANRTIEIWHVNGGTITDNVGASATGLSAMTGGSMKVPSSWKMNAKVKGVARGDLVFIFGERENHTLKAQLVLFAAPTAVKAVPRATPTATATVTAAPTVTATPTATATVVPAATATATAPVASATAVGTHS
jgi:hypothetical protein